MFLGNIFTGLFWMHIAVKTRDTRIIAHTINGIIKSDRYFTIPGVVLITSFGLWAAIDGHLPLVRTGWILWSIVLFSLSGLSFMIKVAPLQKKIKLIFENLSKENDFDWKSFMPIYVQWEIWGLIALLTPVVALIMMVLKTPG